MNSNINEISKEVLRLMKKFGGNDFDRLVGLVQEEIYRKNEIFDVCTLSIYADALLIVNLLENDFFEGDYDGRDSMAYYTAEDDVMKVVDMINRIDPDFKGWFYSSEFILKSRYHINIEYGKTKLDYDFLKNIRPKWLKSRKDVGMKENEDDFENTVKEMIRLGVSSPLEEN